MRIKEVLAGVLIVFVLLELSSCDNNSMKQTISTDYGDQLHFEISEQDSMHNDFVLYEISVDTSEYGAYFYEELITIPDNPLDNFKHIVQTDEMNFYYLRNNFIYVYKGRVDSFSENYTLQNHLSMIRVHENDVSKIERTEKALKTLGQTKKLKYLKQYDEIFAFIQDPDIYAIARRWAGGSITDEEIKINSYDGYEKQDLINWALDFAGPYPAN